ncbi:MAG: diguanylate cyclase [Sulfurimonas sp.]|uniref:sensor domain-containing diguanylate cyclase n=1 Tax=Sulfurimonas sp. TaxID=2022749 RepID=UPI0025FC87AA|nr:diguanylate cyclase [Sulfurimonas sp.]MCK9491906.1 diguanylate cyclase [Sulfurimonas sp.]
MKLKISIAFILIFLVCGVFLKFLSTSKRDVIQSAADKNIEFLRVASNSILDTYLLLAQKSYYSTINKETKEILKKFKYADESQKAILRGKLYRLLYKDYEFLTKLNVRQFHFHTHDSKSLLRFHLPYKNGDSLKEIRSSVRIANSEFRDVMGFEGGKLYPGYRYVFPIFDEEEHLGSVEFSISFEGIEKKLRSIFPSFTHKIILDKKTSYEKVFKDHKDFFAPSQLSSDYYLENPTISQINKKASRDPFVNKITDLVKSSEGFLEKLNKKKSFSLPIIHDNKGCVAVFLNLKNLDNESAGYIVSYAPLDEIATAKARYEFFMIIVLVVSLLLFILIVAIIIQMQKVKDEALKIQRFMDVQNSIVILTDGVKFNFANQKFFNFFNYQDIEAFLEKYDCICDLFIRDENFFSLSDVKKDEKHWVESLLNLPGRARIVLMYDSIMTPHAFSISINQYDTNYYVVDFADISDAMSEKLQLQKQVLKDTLTNAYNRVYFDKNIDSILEINKKESSYTAIIFFDIDFFKKVNDTHGHGVGDEVLKTLSDIVRDNIRKDDKLIRWGGEEFIVLLAAKYIEEATKLAEHLRIAIEKYNFDTIGSLTCSFGVSLHKTGDIQNTIKEADERLYQAKRSGRNRVISS